MLTFASVFLSHSSADELLVEAVARHLGRAGILAWIDKDELHASQTLTKSLGGAIKRQTVVAAFLSPASIKSPWVDDELEIAFRIEDDLEINDVVIPISLSDPASLVKDHDRLRPRLLHPDGSRINRLYITPEKIADTETMAIDIAGKLARAVFQKLKIKDSRDVLIYLDQRGNGQRRGEPQDIPSNLRKDLDMIGLVFRPDRGTRSQGETLQGAAWTEIRESMEHGLAEAFGTPRWADTKRIYVLGHAQTGFFYLLGRYFNRNTSARLYCYNMDRRVFTNQKQPLGAVQPSGGNPNCETSHKSITPIANHSHHESISLLLSSEQYVTPVRQYLAAINDSSPLLWVKSNVFRDSDQVMEYIADVVALLSRLRTEHSVRSIRLFNSLPIHVVSLLAANLLHAVDSVKFMEYRRDLQESNPPIGETYVQLEF